MGGDGETELGGLRLIRSTATLSGVSSLPQFLAKSRKKEGKKKTFDFLCRIAAGAETAEFFSLSCAAAAPIAKVLVSNRPRVFKKNKNFSPQRLWIRSGRGGFSLLFLKSALRFKLKPTAFHSPCLPPRSLLNQVCFLNCVKKKVEVTLSLGIKRDQRKK